MAILTIRPYQGELDLQPIANLLNTCEAFDREDIYHSVAGLQFEFSHPKFDPTQDLRLWQDSNGQLLAFAQLWIPDESVSVSDGHLWFSVHPTYRNQGLESEVIAWAETRIRQVAQLRDLPAQLMVGCRDYQRDRIALFEKHQFSYERCFLRMQRSLSEPIPAAQLPEGFQLIDGNNDIDPTAWVDLHNQSFIDHWNFHALTIEEVKHYLNHPNYRTELDLVAVAADGTYAAFCYAHIDEDDNQQRKCQEGWISMLGTRRGFRRLGLGRALLLSGLQRLRDAGMETALLGVDVQNPNQAYRLYESVGFRKLLTTFLYSKTL